jgi:CspA family cold shock protein
MTARNTLAAVLCAAALALLAYLIELSAHLSEPGAYFVTALFAATFTLLLTQRTAVTQHHPRRAPIPATVAAFNHGTLRAGKERGSVKWFSASKGFGFITRDSGEDIFVHFRSIHGSGHRILHEGQRVEFAVSEGSKGLQAEDVTALK